MDEIKSKGREKGGKEKKKKENMVQGEEAKLSGL